MALTQAAYRFGSDTGTNETDHGWLALQDTAIRCGVGGDVALDAVFLLGVGYQNDANAVANQNFTLQYKINAGSWVNLTTTSAGVKAIAAAVEASDVRPAPENCPACAMGLTAESTFSGSMRMKTDSSP